METRNYKLNDPYFEKSTDISSAVSRLPLTVLRDGLGQYVEIDMAGELRFTKPEFAQLFEADEIVLTNTDTI